MMNREDWTIRQNTSFHHLCISHRNTMIQQIAYKFPIGFINLLKIMLFFESYSTILVIFVVNTCNTLLYHQFSNSVRKTEHYMYSLHISLKFCCKSILGGIIRFPAASWHNCKWSNCKCENVKNDSELLSAQQPERAANFLKKRVASFLLFSRFEPLSQLFNK